jgi:hypothetical protein
MAGLLQPQFGGGLDALEGFVDLHPDCLGTMEPIARRVQIVEDGRQKARRPFDSFDVP